MGKTVDKGTRHTRGLEGDGENSATGSLGSDGSEAGIAGGLAQNQAAFRQQLPSLFVRNCF